MIPNGRPMDSTKKSTLRFTFSSERLRTAGLRLHNSNNSWSEKPKLFRCSTFWSTLSFPVAIITSKAISNILEPLLNPNFSACSNDSIIFSVGVVRKRGCFASNFDNASP
eukprot:Gb_12371 [translate_table: standard]